MKNILVVTLSNIGDVVMTTPVIMALAAQFPSAKITVLVGPKAYALLEKSPQIDRVIIYHKKTGFIAKWRLLMELRKNRHDCIVDLRNTPIPALLPGKNRSPLIRRFRKTNMRERHQEILEMMGLCVNNPPPFQFFAANDEQSVLEKLRVKGIAEATGWIVAAPGAASEKKRWPVAHFQEVIRRLAAETGKKVILVGTGNEQPIAEAVAHGILDAVVLCGETTLPETAALLAKAALILANDSAIMHLGFELGVPTVGIFGPTDHEKYGHTGEHFRIAREDAAACSCDDLQRPYAERDCFHGLGPEKVLRLATELLRRQAFSDEDGCLLSSLHDVHRSAK
ncbi:MAG: glycosyltransferase family 9 protein [Candidatus Competibacteraceae bacterium]